MGNTPEATPLSLAERIAERFKLHGSAIVFLDIEGTGPNAEKDRIVELSMIAVTQDGKSFQFLRRFNPEQPISPDAARIHGISDEDVADEPPFSTSAQKVESFLRGADLGGYNLTRYDLPLLQAEFRRCGITWAWEERNIIDGFQIFVQQEPRDLTAAVEFYCGREFDGAHAAEADVLATMLVLLGQVDRYGEMPTDVAELDEFCRRDEWADRQGKIHRAGDGTLVLGFGKHQGRALDEIEADYLRWMLRKDFPPDTKKIISAVLQERTGG